MNPDDLKNNQNNSKKPKDEGFDINDLSNQEIPDFVPGVPEIDSNLPDFDPTLYDVNSYNEDLFGDNDSYSDEMNQYLSDAVSDIGVTSKKEIPDDDLNPSDPFGLGTDDNDFNFDNIPELEPSRDILSDGLSLDDEESSFMPPTPDEIENDMKEEASSVVLDSTETEEVEDNVQEEIDDIIPNDTDDMVSDTVSSETTQDVDNSIFEDNIETPQNTNDLDLEENIEIPQETSSLDLEENIEIPEETNSLNLEENVEIPQETNNVSYDDNYEVSEDVNNMTPNLSVVPDDNSYVSSALDELGQTTNYDNVSLDDTNLNYDESIDNPFPNVNVDLNDYNNQSVDYNDNNQVVDFDSSFGEAVTDLNDMQYSQDYNSQNYDVQNLDTQNYTQGYSDPNYNNQDYYNQGYTDPNYSAQGYTDPNYSAQGYTDPNYSAQGYTDPNYSAQGYNDPNYSTQGYSDPNYNNQNYNVQGYNPPDINNGVSNDYNNSSFNEPNFAAPEQNQPAQNIGNVGEPLKAPNSVKNNKKPKAKKGGFGKVLVFFLILVLIAGIAYGGYYVYKNYIQSAGMSLKDKFFTSIANSNVLDVAPDSQLMDTFSKVLDESHTSKIDLSFDSDMDFVTNISSNQGIDLNKLKLVAETIVNKENDKSQLLLKANYANNDIATYEEIINKEYMATKTEGITEKYLSTTGKYTTSESGVTSFMVVNPNSLISNYLPTNKNSAIKIRNSNESIEMTDDEIKTLVSKYLKIVADQFVDDQFTQTENVKLQGVDGSVTGIKLKLANSQVVSIEKALIEAILADKELINKVASTEEDNTIKSNSFEAVNTQVPSLVDEGTQEKEVAPVEGQTTSLQAQLSDMQPVSTDDNIVTGTYSNDDIVSTFTTTEDPFTQNITSSDSIDKTTTLDDFDDDDDTYTTGYTAYAGTGLSDVITSIITRSKTTHTAEEIEAALKYNISMAEKSSKNSEYEIALYESDNKVRRLEINNSESKITMDFTYGEKNTIKVTVLSSQFDGLDEGVNSVVDNINEAVPELTKDIFDVEAPQELQATNTTTITDSPNTAPSLPNFSNTQDPDNNTVQGSNTVSNTTDTNSVANVVTNTTANTTNTTETQGTPSQLNAGLTEGDEVLSNTAALNDERVSSTILDMMPQEEEETNTLSSGTVKKELTNGYSFIVEKTGSDFTSKYSIEFDIINNNSINNKFRLDTSTNGKASSKDVKNTFKFTYNNKSKHFSVVLNYNISFDISKLSIPDFTTENAIFVDKLSSKELDTLYKEIELNNAKMITQIKKDLNLIDDKNTPVEVEQPVVQQPTTTTNRITQDEAQNILVDYISKYMGEVMSRGETFTLKNLETFSIPTHEFSCVVNGEIAIIEIDGYRFHLDSTFNLVAE